MDEELVWIIKLAHDWENRSKACVGPSSADCDRHATQGTAMQTLQGLSAHWVSGWYSKAEPAAGWAPVWRRNTELQSQVMAHRCMRTQLSPTPSSSWVFSYNLFPTCSFYCCSKSQLRGADTTARGPEGSRADTREPRNGYFRSRSIREKRIVWRREKVAVPLRATLIPATPNPPKGPAPRSPLQAAPLASACNISSGKM